MTKQMRWMPAPGHDRLILHLRETVGGVWKPYTAFSQYKTPDLPIPGASKGWTTYQRLRSMGWELVATGKESGVSSEDVA